MAIRRIIILVLILASSVPGGGAVNYFDGTVYQALDRAAAQDKLLMVEFYADWNYKSKWMNTRILGDEAISAMLDRDFVVVQVNTTTPEGADLARQYQVTDYPALVVFSTKGEPIDKIDRTLDKEDFTTRMEQLMLTTSGSTAAWRLQAVYTASESNNIALADRLAMEYLATQPADRVANRNHWRLFEDRNITFYSSAAFEFLLAHRRKFDDAIGQMEVSRLIEDIFADAIMPYAIGTADYDPADIDRLSSQADALDLPGGESLRQMISLATVRHEGYISEYISLVDALVGKVSPSNVLRLVLSLEMAGQGGAKEDRQRAARILNRVRSTFTSPSQQFMLDNLHSALQGRENP